MDIGSLTGRIELEDQMSSVLTRVNTLLDEFGDSATRQLDKTKNFNASLTSLGKTFSVGVTAPIVAAGTAMVMSSMQISGAMNIIAKTTGQTGDALQGLGDDFKSVFKDVPNSAAEVAKAVADVNVRLGFTGTELQKITKQFIEYANVNNVEVAGATRSVTTLMKALELDVNDVGLVMDKLTYASQQSGISVNRMAEGVIAGGLAFVEMGFGLDESIALFAQFEKVGANVTDVTSSLHRTLANMAKEGVTDTKKAFSLLLDQIKAAPTYMDASRLSIEAFGAKAGPKLTEEIRGGTYAVEGFVKALQGVEGLTLRSAAASESFSEKMAKLRNQVTLALGPLGKQLVDGFQRMIPALESATKLLVLAVDTFSRLPQPVQTTAFALVGLVAAVGPTLIAIGSVAKGLSSISRVFGGAQVAIFALGNTIPVLTARIWLMDIAAKAAGVSLKMLGAGGIIIGSSIAVVTAAWQAWKLWAENADRAASAAKQLVHDQSNLERLNKEMGTSFKDLGMATATWYARTRELTPAIKELGETTKIAGTQVAATLKELDENAQLYLKRELEYLDQKKVALEQLDENAKLYLQRELDGIAITDKATEALKEQQKAQEELEAVGRAAHREVQNAAIAASQGFVIAAQKARDLAQAVWDAANAARALQSFSFDLDPSDPRYVPEGAHRAPTKDNIFAWEWDKGKGPPTEETGSDAPAGMFGAAPSTTPPSSNVKTVAPRGGGIVMNNEWYVNGTAEESAKKIKAIILNDLKFGMQLPSA